MIFSKVLWERRLNEVCHLFALVVVACIHIAIDTGKNNFEPILFQSLLDYDVAIQYFINIYLASAVVNDLKLNEKLWSKK